MINDEVRWQEGHTSRQIIRKQLERSPEYIDKILSEIVVINGEPLDTFLLRAIDKLKQGRKSV